MTNKANIKNIFYNSYNNLYDNTIAFYKKDKKQIKKAKILLRLTHKYYNELSKIYKVPYIMNNLFNYIYN